MTSGKGQPRSKTGRSGDPVAGGGSDPAADAEAKSGMHAGAKARPKVAGKGHAKSEAAGMPRTGVRAGVKDGVNALSPGGGMPGLDGPAMPASGIVDYATAQQYLLSRLNVERMRPAQVNREQVLRLDRMKAIMSELGEPQAGLRVVHVAGSKGKGSVCEMTAASLEACGYTVGLYTSPHLVDARERVRINQMMIPREEFAGLLSRAALAGERVSREVGEATHFELFTATAFLHFAAQAVDLAVVEVGLGGRVDATNVVLPAVCVITAIQMEHAELLGGTLEAIAREKAGIMKAGVPCVTLAQKPEVMGVFREVSAGVGAPLRVLGQDIEFTSRFESSPELGPHTRVVVTTSRSNFEHVPVPLRGEHQAANCGLALAAVDELRGQGLEVSELKVAMGLASTRAHGRLELVSRQPRVFVDGAHNPESVAGVLKAVGSHLRYDSLVVIFGCAADKDVGGMLKRLSTSADKVFFTKAASSARAADPRDLQKRFAELCPKMTQVAPTIKDALAMASQAVGREDLILVMGSFAVAGEAKRLLQDRPGGVGVGLGSGPMPEPKGLGGRSLGGAGGAGGVGGAAGRGEA